MVRDGRSRGRGAFPVTSTAFERRSLAPFCPIARVMSRCGPLGVHLLSLPTAPRAILPGSVKRSRLDGREWTLILILDEQESVVKGIFGWCPVDVRFLF